MTLGTGGRVRRKMITRGLAAQRLGVSELRIRQLESDGTLWPRLDASGIHWFDRDDIEDLRRKRAEERGEDPDQEDPEENVCPNCRWDLCR